ncbi:MAG: hypothetical protein MR218_06220 [Eubacterium sp.]|nr:hypothetical protein [Eubacterium sp.]
MSSRGTSRIRCTAGVVSEQPGYKPDSLRGRVVVEQPVQSPFAGGRENCEILVPVYDS